jgi:hypothetical protein
MANDMQVSFLGRSLGTASGWDEDLGECWWVYDFVPNADCPFPACDSLQFTDNGYILAQDKDGNDLQRWKINWTPELAVVNVK